MNRREQKYFSALDWKHVESSWSVTASDSSEHEHVFSSDKWRAVYTESNNPIGYGCSLSISNGKKMYDSWSFGLGGTGGKLGSIFRRLIKLRKRQEQLEKEKMLV